MKKKKAPIVVEEKKQYPIGSEHYELYEEVGHGGSGTVRRAQCIPFDEIVAIKILDFENSKADLVILLFSLYKFVVLNSICAFSICFNCKSLDSVIVFCFLMSDELDSQSALFNCKSL